jgi:hypothetical protein
MIRAGLGLYALLGGLSRHARFDTLPRARWDGLDGLDTRGLQAVFRYEDAQTDDTLLTQAVMRSAQKLGAELRCPANFLSARRRDDDYVVHILEGKDEHICRAKALVNAAVPRQCRWIWSRAHTSWSKTKPAMASIIWKRRKTGAPCSSCPGSNTPWWARRKLASTAISRQ